MSFNGMKLKLAEHKVTDMVELPRFSLGYTPLKTDNRSNNSSYGILSALKQDNDVIMEITDSLLSLKKKEREEYTYNFLKFFKELDISYVSGKTPYVPSRGLLSLFSKPKIEEAIDIYAYITNEQWLSSGFQEIYPYLGAKYHICRKDTQINIEDMLKMSNMEKLPLFEFIIFDSGILHSMGINSKEKNLNDIKSILGL